MTEEIKETVVGYLTKNGPWVVLSFLLLAGIGWEAHYIVSTVGASVKDYVQVSGENVKRLNAAMADVQVAHASMLTSLGELQSNRAELLQGVVQNRTELQRILSLMEDATKLMQNVPSQREEELKLLRQIEEGIAALRAVAGGTDES